MKNNKTISVVICAYNEEPTIGTVIEKVLNLDFVDELVVVNNGSTDKTGEIIQSKMSDKRLKLVVVEKNCGLGFGLVKGIKATTGDVVARQDADLEYDPNEIIDIIQPILNNQGTVSYGSRMLVRKAHRCNYYYNYLANVLFTNLVNAFVNLNFTDIETAAKTFDGKLIRSLDFKAKGFDIEIEMLFKLWKAQACFYEVPISYYGRRVEEGKKIKLWDAFVTIGSIAKFSFLSFFWRFNK